jgi:DNA-directed RNA polymerase specialized sigma24 family protein
MKYEHQAITFEHVLSADQDVGTMTVVTATPHVDGDNGKSRPATLGDVLGYVADGTGVVPEHEWSALVRAIATGDQGALHTLFERTNRLVFTLIMRIVGNPHTAEELTLDVFHDVWRRAGQYEPAGAPVVGWILNQARSRAIDRSDPHELSPLQDQHRQVQTALTQLTPEERDAIEIACFSGLTYSEVAAQLCAPVGTIKTRVRSALSRLRQALVADEHPMSGDVRCSQVELVSIYVLQALPESEVASVEAHIYGCACCQQELVSLRPALQAFAFWPTDVLRPSRSLRSRLAWRIAAESEGRIQLPPRPPEPGPRWAEVAQGISCAILARHEERHYVSMLVRLAPGTDYPPHTHADIEELHLLNGELWIDDRKLHPGDYNRSEPGTVDRRVWSETGCTCVLMTSMRDELR